jgi:hypothetical protein
MPAALVAAAEASVPFLWLPSCCERLAVRRSITSRRRGTWLSKPVTLTTRPVVSDCKKIDIRSFVRSFKRIQNKVVVVVVVAFAVVRRRRLKNWKLIWFSANHPSVMREIPSIWTRCTVYQHLSPAPPPLLFLLIHVPPTRSSSPRSTHRRRRSLGHSVPCERRGGKAWSGRACSKLRESEHARGRASWAALRIAPTGVNATRARAPAFLARCCPHYPSHASFCCPRDPHFAFLVP